MTWIPPVTWEIAVVRKKPWLMPFVWVTEGSRTHATALIVVASGVEMTRDCPRPTDAGTELIEGRASANR